MENLYLKIQNRMDSKESACFLARSCLTDLICESEVMEALKELRLSTEMPELARFICKKARILFAILIWAEKEDEIELFYRNNFTDSLLPIKVNFNSGEKYALESLAPNGTYSRAVNETFSSWKLRSINHFCEVQWLFLVPVFREEQFQYRFDKNSRLPFLNIKSVNDGNFSVVCEAYIHKDHLQVRKESKLVRVDLLLSRAHHASCV